MSMKQRHRLFLSLVNGLPDLQRFNRMQSKTQSNTITPQIPSLLISRQQASDNGLSASQYIDQKDAFKLLPTIHDIFNKFPIYMNAHFWTTIVINFIKSRGIFSNIYN